MSGRSNIPTFFKTVAGVLAVAVVISGITIYFTRQQQRIFFTFDPENAYVYTFKEEFCNLDYQERPDKSIGVLSDGFSPLCLFGCFRGATREELRNSLLLTAPERKDEDNSQKPRFTYLSPGKGIITVELDMRKGEFIREKYPYSNRLIVELKDDEKIDGLSVTAFGYGYPAGNSVPGEVEQTKKTFTVSGDFGESKVLSLSEPLYVKRVKFDVDAEASNRLGLRSIGLYLERARYLDTVRRVQNTLPLENRGELNDLKAVLEKARMLDPYSPRTDYLLAAINSLTGNFKEAMARVDRAIEKMEKFEGFSFTGIDWNDLYGRKARIAKELGKWKVAIEYMKKTVPEVDNDFLSDVYLDKYLETGDQEDIKSSFFNAGLVFQDTPRLVLGGLEKYSGQKGLVIRGLDYFRKSVEKVDSDLYRLREGRNLPGFQLKLGLALLELWRGTNEGLDTSLNELADAAELADSPEKQALVSAVKSRVYRKLGREQEADELERESINYFSQYSSLYDDWVEFLESA